MISTRESNQYVREAEFQSKVNVALPVASLGVAGQPEPEVKFSDRRGRRGGRKQRDRDGDRQAKAIRTQVENAKAVPSFGRNARVAHCAGRRGPCKR